MRLAAAGVRCRDLTAAFLTHHHSDHLSGLEDVVMTRWTSGGSAAPSPLVVVAPEGASSEFAHRMLDHWEADLSVRQAHTGAGTKPTVEVRSFRPTEELQTVWRFTDDDSIGPTNFGKNTTESVGLCGRMSSGISRMRDQVFRRNTLK